VLLLYTAITKGAMRPFYSLNLEVRLVRCLTKISQSYFAPGRSLVISSPATYRDVQQELIAEIHRTVNWSLVVTVGGNISVPENSDFIDSDCSYITLTLDGNIECIEADILGLITDRNKEFPSLWISKARFVVAGTNEFSMSQQTFLFDYFSKFRILLNVRKQGT